MAFWSALTVFGTAACGNQAIDGVAKSANSNNAPQIAVPHPLDVTRYAAAPCSAMDAAHLRKFNGRAPGRPARSFTGDPACSWDFGGPHVVGGVIVAHADDGLRLLYRLQLVGEYLEGYFSPTEVADYPAVFHSRDDGRPDGACTLGVGVNAQWYLVLTVIGRPGDDSCTAVRNLAGAVLDRIEQGG
ncbi:DUF3558 family protein [Amycolatopsis jiangsuensis]|uniref:DUF3558 domain-containing protein n=1 Tax=Amycolatopsis jiangsuensis TaxID=1181879 RepID=A0A840J1L9_9PSEU|nr:DUF3558 family protein [Amycolatopsis jiangsuensis]MBB4687960.1 hypothetical protein [Amycolatopsis jiangsuensis]